MRIEPATSPRLSIVDAARGLAILMMIAYHFCFDLTWYGWAAWPMLDDHRWIAWRSTIVACFLLLVGLSLALRDASDQGRKLRGFVHRWLRIAGAALLVTIGSWLLFPASFIYFGVLHFVAVALWICRLAPRLGVGAIALGIAAIVAGVAIADPGFDPKPIDWIGFAATKPITEDYVPLFPWIGVVLIGCGLGRIWTRRGCRLAGPILIAWQAVPTRLQRALAGMGRHSLAIYLIHQPLLLGALGVVKQIG